MLKHDNSGKGDVSNYDNHPSMISTKQHMAYKNQVFSFRNITKKISSAIKTLNGKKKPLYLMRYLPKSFSSLVKFLRIFFLITPVESGMFPDELKLAEVLPVF